MLSVPLASNSGVSPATIFPKSSLMVIVIVESAIPSASTGPVPVMVDCDPGAPAINVTVPPTGLLTGAVMLRVFTSALVAASVHTDTPPVSPMVHPP